MAKPQCMSLLAKRPAITRKITRTWSEIILLNKTDMKNSLPGTSIDCGS